MEYVYLLQSIPFLDQRYIGVTHNFRHRLQEHNSGESPHTSRYRAARDALMAASVGPRS
ncbi:MAG TPA: GIY-YIG nuclease family protein [Planctomycetota bacterium]|nr:GIY-YIG nuclease family protein [Planctomycetota bacterium]